MIGRPKTEIDMERLQRLLHQSLTMHEIAGRLGCSFDVLRARMREAGLSRKRDPMKVCRFGGHDLTKPGSKSKNGQCRICKRESARARRHDPTLPLFDALGRRYKGLHVPIDLDRVLALRDQGMDLREIAQVLQVAYSTLTKRTAQAGISFMRGMTRERWALRRVRCAAGQESRPRAADLEIARQQALQAEYLAAFAEEETMPRYLRGRAAQLKVAMQSKRIAQ